MLSKDDRILITVLRIEKPYGAKKVITKFPRNNWLVDSNNRLLHQTDLTGSAGSVTLIICKKNNSLRNCNALTKVSLTQQSASSDSDCIAVSVRMEDTLNVKFKRFL